MLSGSIVLQVVVLAFAAGGAWMAVKTAAHAAKKLATEAHAKIDALASEVRAGFAAVHKRLDAAGTAAKADVSNVVDIARGK